jgi:probable HAF family extracellular repeat protein
MNVAGHVAGRAGSLNGTDTRAVLWTLSGIERLGSLPGRPGSATLPAGDYSAAFGINDHGTVVGSSNTSTTVMPFIWSSGRGLRALPPLLGDTGGEAFDVNNGEMAVGYSTGPHGAVAVIWPPDAEEPEGIGTLPGGASSRGYAINNRGQVAGTSNSHAGTRAFMWTRGTGMQNLGTLPGDTSSEAVGINDSGEVIGSSSGPGGTRGFRWTAAAGMVSLGTLPGGHYSRAMAINNRGEIVGTSTSAEGTRAVLWSSTNAIQDLNTLLVPVVDLVLSEAQAINANGQIAALSGGGEHADGAEHNDHFYHVFFLNPSGTVGR